MHERVKGLGTKPGTLTRPLKLSARPTRRGPNPSDPRGIARSRAKLQRAPQKPRESAAGAAAVLPRRCSQCHPARGLQKTPARMAVRGRFLKPAARLVGSRGGPSQPANPKRANQPNRPNQPTNRPAASQPTQPTQPPANATRRAGKGGAFSISAVDAISIPLQRLLPKASIAAVV